MRGLDDNDKDGGADTRAKRRGGMSDDELIGITDKLIADAMGYMGGKLSEQRRRNQYFYLAEAVEELAPPSVDGRSSVVSTDVADTVEWMLPSLLKTFTAGDNVVEFTPRRREDEEGAKQATEFVNYVLHKQNPGFQLLYTWIKDALVQKTGVMKVWWDDTEEDTREVYRGLSDQGVQMLLQQPEVEPIEHTVYPDPSAEAVAQNMAAMDLPAQPSQTLHDVTVKRRKPRGQVCIENVPPEEFLIARNAKTINGAQFVAHRTEKTISDLRAAGYENVDDIGSDGVDDPGAASVERLTRRSADDDLSFGQDDNPADESQRMVWVTECYLKLDHNGDGIAEWRQVVRCGGVVLRNEECDGPPFVAITPIPMPHRFFGMCPADQAIEVQRLKTSLLRAGLDGLYHSINGRTFAVENQVNLDDLLTNRPGGIVRVKSAGAVGPLSEGRPDLGAAQAMLEYAEVQKENRTGYTRYSQGTNADALNQTATGINVITNRADSRIELIARVFAETGFQDLFKRILQLVSQYQDQATIARVNGKWVEFDPRSWATQFDFTVNVGLGTGNKDQQVQHLMMLSQFQQQVAALGLAGPVQVYNLAAKLAESLGFKQADQYFVNPETAPPKGPPPPDPKVMQAQAEMQLKAHSAQAGQQAEMARLQLDRDKAMSEAQLAREKLEAEITLKREEMAATLGWQREQAAFQALQRQSDAMVTDAGEAPQQPQQAQPDAAGLLAQLVQAINPPRRKRVSITAPSGMTYQGDITDDLHDQMPGVGGGANQQPGAVI